MNFLLKIFCQSSSEALFYGHFIKAFSVLYTKSLFYAFHIYAFYYVLIYVLISIIQFVVLANF